MRERNKNTLSRTYVKRIYADIRAKNVTRNFIYAKIKLRLKQRVKEPSTNNEKIRKMA